MHHHEQRHGDLQAHGGAISRMVVAVPLVLLPNTDSQQILFI